MYICISVDIGKQTEKAFDGWEWSSSETTQELQQDVLLGQYYSRGAGFGWYRGWDHLYAAGSGFCRSE